jgi:hypothetical protein
VQVGEAGTAFYLFLSHKSTKRLNLDGEAVKRRSLDSWIMELNIVELAKKQKERKP